MTDEETARIRAIAEAVVETLAARGLVVDASTCETARMLNVREVASLLGRSAAWVYEHATELGAVRMGDGPKPRIGFDLAALEEWKRDHRLRAARAQARPSRDARRTTGSRGIDLIPYEANGTPGVASKAC